MIEKRSKKKGLKTTNDKKSLIIFWVTLPLSITIGFYNANYQVWDSLNQRLAYIGLGIFLLGILIRWISILQLKKEFTVDVAISDGHKLKTDGFYKVLRHPSYLGLLLTCFGLSLAMNSILSLLIISIPLLLAILYRIKVEENILIAEFGKSYEDYMQKTYKIILKLY